MSGLDWFNLIAGAALGAAASFVSVVVTDNYRKPRLALRVKYKDEPNSGTSEKSGSTYGYFHIIVENIGRTPAYECEIEISFLKKNGALVLKEVIKGKWDKAPNPFITIDGKDHPQRSFLHLSQYANIRPHKEETFCILVKYEKEKECYAFSAENYMDEQLLPDYLQMPTRKITEDEFYARVQIHGGNVKQEAIFHIENKLAGFEAVHIKLERHDPFTP